MREKVGDVQRKTLKFIKLMILLEKTFINEKKVWILLRKI